MEDKAGIETGGNSEYAPNGDPWEREIMVVNSSRMILASFILGVIAGILVMGFFFWG